MKLIVGLGNPGKEYEATRHNIGASFVDFKAKQYSLSFTSKFQSLFAEFNHNGEKIMLLKPQTYMNLSGSAVLEATKFYKLTPNDIIIVFDDLDIKEGEYKIQRKKYPKFHNGVNDIIKRIASDEFWYVRIGIDARNPHERSFIPGRDYVLQKTNNDFTELFSKVDNELIEKLKKTDCE